MFKADDITIDGFLKIFNRIIEEKNKAGICSVYDNPGDLLERAKLYGVHYKNDSWGWSSNIWSRSAAGSLVIEKDADLKPEHRWLMQNVLEHILTRPLIKTDAIVGAPDTPVAMKARLYCDPQFPDIAFRWKELNFPSNPKATPDVELFCIPHYLENPNVPGKNKMMLVLRFPSANYTIVTASSYQGEVKKGFLTHWIQHVYAKGGTGEHASLKEFTVKKSDGNKKRVVMCVWGLSGSGKSTHGLYVVDENVNKKFVDAFGVNLLDFVSDQVIKNDDIVSVFRDRVYCSESGSWTKTEDVNKSQPAIYKASVSSRALHENTEWDKNGNVSFLGEYFQYRGKPNQNARTVLYLDDTGYYDGVPYSSEALNMAVFISPGYLADYAWVKITDPAFACKVLADGRTVGHPAQSREGVGEEKYESRYCLPFTMGFSNAGHVHRFHEFMMERQNTSNPIEVYLLNTTGRIGTEYQWTEVDLGKEKVKTAKPKFTEISGKIKPVGGIGPSIEETELFLMQAARGAVKYQPHPFWGDKVLVPVEVPGLSKEKLMKFNPFTYHPAADIKTFLQAQVKVSKYYLDIQCPGLTPDIKNAMDFSG